ncbi:SatD family protein [Microbacterium sp. ET2]|uniref:SatD family protein n=1 Tax=Microbacterium albipurpureum TaxID=3050384 RepID=UPI00259C729A|nr:SatD family protein [Microbacterium sp. ET2 (Ac-2212)]WJL95330.1 SatD family protein [Microbacterium sp. ET2 (Ac-2212)]
MPTVVIADIVSSRELANRRAAQRDLETALARVAEDGPPAERALLPVVGDEMQGVYPHLSSALAATLLLQLALPEGVELRFGIGLGDIEEIPSVGGALSEGEAWWAARAAIENVERLARRVAPSARTWVAAARAAPAEITELVRVANSGLLARDRAIAQLSPRTRRLVYGRWLGRTQSDLAATEGVVQSAVSQALTSAEAGALIEGLQVLVGDRG